MYLFFDTETTGLPQDYKAPATALQNWPRIVQLAWLLADGDGNEVASVEYTIKPDGFTIPEDAIRVHGISNELALREGIALATALAAIEADIGKASSLVAHNIAFDEKVLGAEFLRAGRANIVESRPRLCTMLLSTNYCQLPGPRGYKWPSLTALHSKLFDEPMVGAHHALVDARACARCFFELRRRKVIA
jgi:DNA polymerase-3 subunit epsilon